MIGIIRIAELVAAFVGVPVVTAVATAAHGLEVQLLVAKHRMIGDGMYVVGDREPGFWS